MDENKRWYYNHKNQKIDALNVRFLRNLIIEDPHGSSDQNRPNLFYDMQSFYPWSRHLRNKHLQLENISFGHEIIKCEFLCSRA